ncbi:MAG: uroporphyrinogen-III synthase [Alphaproteobacteria bacterium]
MKKILITRPIEDAKETALIFQKEGFKVVISPIITIQPIDYKLEALKNYPYIITSSNALRILVKILKNRDNLLFCIGKKTAQTAKELGFKNVIYPESKNYSPSIKSLEDFLLKNFQQNKNYLHFCGKDTADEFTKINVEKHIIYESKFNPEFNLKPEMADILTFFSPLSARYFLEYAQNNNILEAIKPLVIYTLSDSVAKIFSSIGCINIYSAEKITGNVSADNLIKLIIDNERSKSKQTSGKQIGGK